MYSVTQDPVPESSLLKTYRGGERPASWGAYCDCFSVSIDQRVTLAQFVAAFYTTPVFKLERLVLRVLLRIPSNDEQARALAAGTCNHFAAWRVGARTETQLLMCDVRGHTRSWFAVSALSGDAKAQTLLQFGSGIASTLNPKTGHPEMSRGFHWLAGFHVRYSHVLLLAAKRRLQKNSAPG